MSPISPVVTECGYNPPEQLLLALSLPLSLFLSLLRSYFFQQRNRFDSQTADVKDRQANRQKKTDIHIVDINKHTKKYLASAVLLPRGP